MRTSIYRESTIDVAFSFAVPNIAPDFRITDNHETAVLTEAVFLDCNFLITNGL